MKNKALQIVFILIVAAASSSAQVSSPVENPAADILNPRPTEVRDRSLGRDMLPYELTRAAEKLVDVTREEREKFAEERKTGGMKMLKLFSAPRCASERLVVDVGSSECAAAIDYIRASFYSFRTGLYGESLMDIRILENRMLAGNGGFVHGFIVDIGKADVARLNSKHELVKALAEHPIAKTLDEETDQRRDLASGFSVGGVTASSSVRLVEGNVYLIRIVSYGSKRDDRANPFEGVSRAVFFRDQVFIVKFGGMNKDNVAMLLWKKVSDKPAPKL